MHFEVGGAGFRFQPSWPSLIDIIFIWAGSEKSRRTMAEPDNGISTASDITCMRERERERDSANRRRFLPAVSIM